MTTTPLGNDHLTTLRALLIFTISYNLIESVIALTAGTTADSSALIGFGLDSLIEVSSASAVVWQYSSSHSASREAITLRIIGASFFGLAAFVSFDAVRALIAQQSPDDSPIGIGLAAVSLVVMPVVSLTQRRVGQQMGSSTAVADSKQTLICAYLSAVLLGGLLANSFLGWWWADPIAALTISGMAIREGRHAWRGDACCTPDASLFQNEVADAHSGCGCAPGSTCCTV